MEVNKLKHIIKEEIRKQLKEIKINNPSVTSEKIINLIKNKYKFNIGRIWEIFYKYNIPNGARVENWVETLSQIEKSNLYQDLLKLKNG